LLRGKEETAARTAHGRTNVKHIRKITSRRADAFTDFLNDLQRAWSNFVFAKKNELVP
jgi:hypothetical protein